MYGVYVFGVGVQAARGTFQHDRAALYVHTKHNCQTLVLIVEPPLHAYRGEISCVIRWRFLSPSVSDASSNVSVMSVSRYVHDVHTVTVCYRQRKSGGARCRLGHYRGTRLHNLIVGGQTEVERSVESGQCRDDGTEFRTGILRCLGYLHYLRFLRFGMHGVVTTCLHYNTSLCRTLPVGTLAHHQPSLKADDYCGWRAHATNSATLLCRYLFPVRPNAEGSCTEERTVALVWRARRRIANAL